MVNPTYEKLGSAPSMIRELFAYGLRRSAEVGPEHVYDYSLGNPSIPAPQPVQQALLDVLHDTDPIQVHGYSMAGGFDGTRRAVAGDLTRRFGMTIRPEELFFTCGAAAALISAKVDAVFTPTDNVIMAAELAIADDLAKAGIPHYTGADSFVRNGAFATCGVNYTELGTRTATLVYQAMTQGMDGMEDYYRMDGGIITVNTDTAAVLKADYSVFAQMAQLVEVTTTKD